MSVGREPLVGFRLSLFVATESPKLNLITKYIFKLVSYKVLSKLSFSLFIRSFKDNFSFISQAFFYDICVFSD